MRGPTKTPQHIESEKVFAEVKKAKGLEGATIFTPGFKEIHQGFNRAYKAGMTTEETLAAMEV